MPPCSRSEVLEPGVTRLFDLWALLGDLGQVNLEGIHWVIVGGESGHGARPMDPAWVRSIQTQCKRASVPFFFKQWGGVMKSRAGRELDGQTWDAMPESRVSVPPERSEVDQLLIAGRKSSKSFSI